MTVPPTKTERDALALASKLRQYGPLDIHTLGKRTGLEERELRAALRFTNRNLGTEAMANEIVCCAKVGDSHVYFLAEADDQAAAYTTHRKKIANGHVKSCIALETKALEKWPSPQRSAAIKMLEMAGELLATAPGSN